MGLQSKVIEYLDAIRNDTNDPHRIDRYKKLLLSKSFQENQAYSQKVAGLVNVLFYTLPEITEADPYHKKLYALREYCDHLPSMKKKPKSSR